jgi:hypothetical protein
MRKRPNWNGPPEPGLPNGEVVKRLGNPAVVRAMKVIKNRLVIKLYQGVT